MANLRADMSPADGARIAVPDGWVEVDPGPDVATTQVVTLADWDATPGLRPTMTVVATPSGPHGVASRVLAEAQANLSEVLVVSIDPWRLPDSAALGRRLVFAHTDGDLTLSTLAWAIGTAGGDVVVTAHAESTELHRYDAAFAQAVAGISLPGAAATPTHPDASADLARQVRSGPWDEVAPTPRAPRTAIVADPDARILVEASVGGATHRFDATLVGGQATVSATCSPRASSQAADVPGSPPATYRVPVSRLALAVAQWLGLGPARTPSGAAATIPISVVMRRLLDPTVPAPDGVDRAAWSEPWFLWTLRSSATDSGLVMVDTGTSGQCAVMETDDERTTRFAPLSSYNVWLTLNWLISESRVA
ncbi:MAG TPA: hypothetical protein VFE07_05890 [Marmoricola sp.]|nr:hypothetical protein [Marmoricola sp.]